MPHIVEVLDSLQEVQEQPAFVQILGVLAKFGQYCGGSFMGLPNLKCKCIKPKPRCPYKHRAIDGNGRIET